MQLSYDNERFTSEWIALNDGHRHRLDMIMAIFVYSGSEIHEVTHRLSYKQVGPDDAPGHGDRYATVAVSRVRNAVRDGGVDIPLPQHSPPSHHYSIPSPYRIPWPPHRIPSSPHINPDPCGMPGSPSHTTGSKRWRRTRGAASTSCL